jgi:hypothetical protein
MNILWRNIQVAQYPRQTSLLRCYGSLEVKLDEISFIERSCPRFSGAITQSVSVRDHVMNEIVLEILSQYCSRLLKEPATILR